MPPVRNGAQKWKNRSAAAQADYTAGVKNPRRSWAQATAAAADAYVQGVQQAIASGRFQSGVAKAGDQKWSQQAATLGTQRYAQGVQASGANYEQGFAPYRQVIESTNLPERGPKGDPRNYLRSQAIGEALHNAKIRNTGG